MTDATAIEHCLKLAGAIQQYWSGWRVVEITRESRCCDSDRFPDGSGGLQRLGSYKVKHTVGCAAPVAVFYMQIRDDFTCDRETLEQSPILQHTCIRDRPKNNSWVKTWTTVLRNRVETGNQSCSMLQQRSRLPQQVYDLEDWLHYVCGGLQLFDLDVCAAHFCLPQGLTKATPQGWCFPGGGPVFAVDLS